MFSLARHRGFLFGRPLLNHRRHVFSSCLDLILRARQHYWMCARLFQAAMQVRIGFLVKSRPFSYQVSRGCSRFCANAGARENTSSATEKRSPNRSRQGGMVFAAGESEGSGSASESESEDPDHVDSAPEASAEYGDFFAGREATPRDWVLSNVCSRMGAQQTCY